MRTLTSFFVTCLFFAASARSQPYTISTIAGMNRLLDGHPATSAPLRGPIAVAADTAGNLYIADEFDNRIRKVDATGIISTYAGTGRPGYGGDRGAATAAQLFFPISIALDAKGNLYVADQGNAVIRRISSDGIINTVAGTGRAGYGGDNGRATAAQIDPSAVAVDSQGNYYIADGSNYRIRKVDANGIITTIAGTGASGSSGDNGPATAAQIDFVTDLVVDSSGNIYLADYYNYEVRRIDTKGMITTVAGGVQFGSVGDGVLATTAVMIPAALALDGSGNLYISDDNVNNTVIRRVDLSNDLIYTLAGNGQVGFGGDNGLAVNAQLNSPAGLAVSGTQVYIADLQNLRVRKVSTASNVITTVAGTDIHDLGPATSAFLNFPEGLAIDGAGNIVVADTDNSEARRFKSGGHITSFGQVLGSPAGVAVDPTGNFYVSDEEPGFAGETPHVLRIEPDGTTSVVAGAGANGYAGDGGPAAIAALNLPQGIAVDAARNTYIADWGNNRVRKVDTQGNINTIAGNGKLTFSGDNGPATAAGIDPYDVAIDSSGNLFVVDQLNNRIRKVATDGTITTVVGTGSPGYTGDGGPAAEAQLNFPTGIAVDHSGNLYIADNHNSVVRRVTAAGLITTIAGNGTFIPSAGDGGPAVAAQLDPWSIAVDATGNVYVSDSFNDRVRQLTPQVVKPANMIVISGDVQSGTVETTLAAPLVLKVTDSTGAGVPGVVVTFTVSPNGAATVNPSPAVTLNDGTVSAKLTLGSTAGQITITAFVPAIGKVSISLTATVSNAPSISAGGITSAGLSNPPVKVMSPNPIVSIFGTNFAPAGTSKQVSSSNLVNGQLPTNLAGVCVEFATVRAPMFAVYPGQVNVQVPTVAPGNAPVQVIIDCDTPQAVASPPISIAVQATAPEFFYFTTNANGGSPIAAINAVTGGYIGAPGLISGATFTPAKPGDYLTLFATGFGATNPPFAPGVLPRGAAPVTAPVSVTFGGVTLDPSAILYVGVSQFAGLYQVNLQVPAGVADGNQPLVITVGGVASPANAFITVRKNQ
jgi:uncharacterized protein (TIGR03437 family)